MKVCNKTACSFQNWYPKFKNVTMRSECVEVPPEVLEYLRSDVVVVPKEALLETKKTSEIDDISYSVWESDGEDDDELPTPSFPEFSARLKSAMEKLGDVFIKTNWSAPYDAVWIATNNSLKCSNLQDVYLLLKGSNRIAVDLEYSFSDSLQCIIVLRKWLDIHPGSEFRCFVSDKQLVAITQRDKSEHHNHIHENKCDIVNDIKNFFSSNIKQNFFLSEFIFDVIWQRGQIKLVDFNQFSSIKESYLFTWEELRQMDYVEGVSPEFRYIGEDVGIQPGNLGRHFGLPSDLTQASERTSRSIIEMIQENIDLQSKETNESN